MAITIITQLCLALLALLMVGALPVIKNPPTQTPEKPKPPQPEENLSYNRYLQEIVSALETDEHFKEKLKNAEQVDIRVSFGY